MSNTNAAFARLNQTNDLLNSTGSYSLQDFCNKSSKGGAVLGGGGGGNVSDSSFTYINLNSSQINSPP
jgi:hypothetical protein